MSILRKLVFGAILGVVGKKLYDNGSLQQFGDDLKTRVGEAKGKLDDFRASAEKAAEDKKIGQG